MIPVFLMAARPDHDIHARSAAEALAHRHVKFAAIQMGVGFGLEAPVAFGSKIRGPERGGEHRFMLVGVASFDQQDLSAFGLREAAGHDGPGGADAADDKVVALPEVGSQPRLVLAGAASEIERLAGAGLSGHDYSFLWKRGVIVPVNQPLRSSAAGFRDVGGIAPASSAADPTPCAGRKPLL